MRLARVEELADEAARQAFQNITLDGLKALSTPFAGTEVIPLTPVISTFTT
jgi:hypothetical protein